MDSPVSIVASSLPQLEEEDQLVAELAHLGVSYLSQPPARDKASPMRQPQQLLAGLVRQPSSRVRLALIALLLANPGYAEWGRAALELLPPREGRLFKLLYTAAVFLQSQYAEALRGHLRGTWRLLPDLFSAELGVPPADPPEALRSLARIHAQTTGANLNWHGTYHHAVRQLLHRWEWEALWNRSHPARS